MSSLVVLTGICAPWILYNAIYSHRLILVSDTGALNFCMSYNPEAKGGFVQILGCENVSQQEYLRISCRKTHAPLFAPVVSYVVLTMLLSIFVVRFRALVEPLLIAYTAVLFGGAALRESEPISSAKPKAPRRA